MFLPFPKGWSRVVATQRHLNEGAAGKTALHRLNARREASIRRSQCGNSEAIVGEMGGSTNRVYSRKRLLPQAPSHSLFTAHLFF